MKYQSEIDGLRAVAVLPVFFFHLGIMFFSGGFVGVDIFFVISGYLITSIIWNDLEKGVFSFSKFYERRMRRILPALYLVLLFSVIFTFLFFMDDEFKYFCRSVLSTLLFYSNLQFWNEAGYFDLKSHMKPLLHTWSLSIEEQFYIFFPSLLILFRKFAKKYVIHILFFLAFLSFVFGLYVLQKDPSSSFYFMHLRAWELLLGSLLALKAFPEVKSKTIHELLSITGLGLIAYSIVGLNAKSSFPGLNALIPCLGTAAIIYCSSFNVSTLVTKFLSNSVFVFVGKISYSLYLWHWPMIVFVKYWMMDKDLLPIYWISIFFMALLFSFLSWKYLEQPIRKKTGIYRNLKPILIGLGVVTVSLCVFSYAGGFMNNSFPTRLSEKVSNYSKGTSDINPMRTQCHNESFKRVKSGKLCELGSDNDRPPQFVVWGDSHADALFPAFDSVAKKSGSYGLYASLSACMPLLGTVKEGQRKCYEFNNLVIDYIRNHQIQNVVLVANWHPGGISFKKDTTKIDVVNENDVSDEEDETMLPATQSAKKYTNEEIKIFRDALENTIINIEKIPANVWFMARVPRSKFEVASVLGRYERFNRPKSGLQINLADYKSSSKLVAEIINELKKKHVINIIDPTHAFCSERTGKCLVEAEGKPIFRDQGHLTTFGANYVSLALLGNFFNSITSGKTLSH
jgi:peptidoglycan/LPS O-acetylase OafA/YrhL